MQFVFIYICDMCFKVYLYFIVFYKVTVVITNKTFILFIFLGAVQKCQHFHKCTNRTLGGEGVTPDVRF